MEEHKKEIIDGIRSFKKTITENNKDKECDISLIESNIVSIVEFEIKYRETHDIFYHGQNFCHIFKDIVSKALFDEEHYYIYEPEYEKLDALDIYSEINKAYQMLPENPSAFNLTEEYKFQGHPNITDHHQLLSKLCMSCLQNLYDNSHHYQESVIKYIQSPTEYTSNIIANSKNMFEMIIINLQKVGITINSDMLKDVYDSFIEESISSQIVIVAIPKGKRNKYVYMSKAMGEPFTTIENKFIVDKIKVHQYRIINLNMSRAYLDIHNIHILKIHNLDEQLKNKYISKIKNAIQARKN